MAGQWLTPVRRVAGVAVTLAVLATGCLPADPPTAASPGPTSSPATGVEADERPPAAVGTATEQPTPRATGPAVRQARSSTALPAQHSARHRDAAQKKADPSPGRPSFAPNRQKDLRTVGQLLRNFA